MAVEQEFERFDAIPGLRDVLPPSVEAVATDQESLVSATIGEGLLYDRGQTRNVLVVVENRYRDARFMCGDAFQNLQQLVISELDVVERPRL